jgi:hypothetical protein
MIKKWNAKMLAMGRALRGRVTVLEAFVGLAIMWTEM